MSDVLLLNFTYEPLNIIDVQRAVQLLFQRKAEIVHDVDGRAMRSTTIEFPLPSVLRLLYYVKNKRQSVALTKKNLLLRDDYTCGYCGARGGREMTADHVVPRAQGGPSTWENLVAACQPCNNRKRDRTPEEAGMPLKRRPKEPRFIPWVVVRRNTMPDEWKNFLGLWSMSVEMRPS